METNEAINTMNDASQTMSRMSDTARAKFSDVSNKVMERSRAAATSTDHYVHEYAWSSVALAALLGVAIGLMLRRS